MLSLLLNPWDNSWFLFFLLYYQHLTVDHSLSFKQLGFFFPTSFMKRLALAFSPPTSFLKFSLNGFLPTPSASLTSQLWSNSRLSTSTFSLCPHYLDNLIHDQIMALNTVFGKVYQILSPGLTSLLNSHCYLTHHMQSSQISGIPNQCHLLPILLHLQSSPFQLMSSF